jgi:hypothetical protein
MAEERSLTKLQQKADKLTDKLKGFGNKLRDARKGASEANKVASKIPAYLLPVIGGIEGYALGYADEMTRTPEVETPVTMLVGGAAWVGSGVAAYFGSPTIATLAGNAASNAAAIVTHSAGRHKAQTSPRAHG